MRAFDCWLAYLRELCTKHLVIAAMFTSPAVTCAEPIHSVLGGMDFVYVGYPGAQRDNRRSYLPEGVPYAFGMGRYEVTIGEYVEFLNAKATSDPYGLYDTRMQSQASIAGISRTGSSGSYSYAATGPLGTTTAGANDPSKRPIAFIDWFSAARFANWMSNGKGPGSTESGAYALNGVNQSPPRSAINPNTGSTPLFYIPTHAEWHKAAFYSPDLGGGAGGYFSFATQSDQIPGNAIGGAANQANFRAWSNFPNGNYYYYSVTGLDGGGWKSGQNYLTEVGAYSASASCFGTSDQSGGLGEWTDTSISAGFRQFVGGSWADTASASGGEAVIGYLAAGQLSVASRSEKTGFRLMSTAAVPEPSTYAMAIASLACGSYLLGRYRKPARSLEATRYMSGAGYAALGWSESPSPGKLGQEIAPFGPAKT